VISWGYPTSIYTCYCRLLDWEELGIWEHIWLRFLSAWEQQGKLDRSQAYLDGSFMPAKKGRVHQLKLEGQTQHCPHDY
jgi:hypothetical protein